MKKKLKDIWQSSKFDPNGSYTGKTDDEKFSKPVQDQDDL